MKKGETKELNDDIKANTKVTIIESSYHDPVANKIQYRRMYHYHYRKYDIYKAIKNNDRKKALEEIKDKVLEDKNGN